MAKLTVMTLLLAGLASMAAVASPAKVGWWDKEQVEGLPLLTSSKPIHNTPRWHVSFGSGFYDPWYWQDWRWRNERWRWNIGFNQYWRWPYYNWPMRYNGIYRNRLPLRPGAGEALREQAQNALPVYKPQRQILSTESTQGLNQLPANAKVVFKDGRYLYLWRDTLYYFDWQTQQYLAVDKHQTHADVVK